MPDDKCVLPSKLDDINERSAEANEILGHIPHWIIRWGISAFFFALLCLLVLSWVIKYPEIITCQVIISTEKPSAPLVARASGQINQLYVKEGDTVTKGQVLAIIQNTLDVNSYNILRKKLHDFEQIIHSPESILSFTFEKNMATGDIQYPYSDFLSSLSNYKSFFLENYYEKKINALKSQLNEYRQMNALLKNQKELCKKDTQIAEKKYNTNKKLFEDGLLSENELDSVYGILLTKQKALSSSENAVVMNAIQIGDLEKQIYDLSFQLQEDKRRMSLSLRESFEKLKSSFSSHELQYVLKAPIDGKVSFFSFWSDNQYVNASDEVMTVFPEARDISGKAYINSFGAGKVQLGQHINIKLNDYPFHEFGMVSGKVKSISSVSRKGQYLVYIELPERLQTSYGKTVHFKQNMTGQAEIITEKLRLIDRIFGQIRHIFTSRINNE